MATYSKVALSGSTNGKQIKVDQSSSSGTLIHTAQSGTTYWDEVWIYAVNSSSTQVQKLTIQWGGTASPDDEIEVVIGTESGYVLVIPGLLLQNSLVVRAYSTNANTILINGYVNRISA
jgi:hypothetical protein